MNAYLREITGAHFTAKDFRTWAGTVLAARALAGRPPCRSAADAKRQVAAAIDGVARSLGNTKAVCRKCYVHPGIIDAYVDGRTIVLKAQAGVRAARAAAGFALSAEERAVVTLLDRGFRRKTA